MNKQIYRLVFNQTRGCLMVVAETATSSGKSASGERVSRGAKKHRGPRGRAALAACESIHRAVLLSAASLCLVPVQVDAQTVATRIVADPAAARTQKATVLNTSNGVTQVNIQTPSEAGVSRNTYSQFDVGASGAILNNSRTNVQTQLGGWVEGNPWLATGTARVILNEVNSSNPSQLQGYVEVAGQRAEVVLANPAGIAVNGGGFINAGSVTLTTGTALLSNGSLQGYRIQGGTVSVDGAGLDTRGADYTAILARAAQVNAEIWADRLQVITGSNIIQAGSLGADLAPQIQRIEGDARVQNYALDVSSLGGMYAGKITLIGTEAGLGVRNDGVVQASSGPLTLAQDGWLASSGTLQASGGDLAVRVQGKIDQSGLVYGSGNVVMVSQGSQTHSGTVAAGGDVLIQASGDGAAIQASGPAIWAAGLQTDGTLSGKQNLTVQASAKVQAAGEALATQHLALQSATLDVSQSSLQAGSIRLQASTGELNARGSQILATDTLQLHTPQALTTDGALLQASTLSTQALSLSNVRGQLIQTGSADQAIALEGKLDNTAGVIQSAGHNLAISAQDIDNTAGQLLHAGGGTFRLDSRGLLQNDTHNGSQEALADGARIVGSAALHVQAQTFDNTGSVNAAGDLLASAATLDNRGVMYATGTQTLVVTQGMVNRGTLAAAKDLTIEAGSLAGNGANMLAAGIAADGKLSGVGALTVNTTGALQSGGQALATGDLHLDAASLDLTGASIGSTEGKVTLAARSGNILTRNAEVSTPGLLSIAANTNGDQLLDNSGGQLSGQQLLVQVGQLDNVGGAIEQTGTGAQSARIQTSGALNNSGGRIVGNANDFGITAGGALNNTDGLLSAVGDLAITSGILSNAATGAGKGVQSQTGNVVLNVQALENAGAIAAAKNLTTTATTVSNSGSMYAGGQQRLAVRDALATSGTIAAAEDLSINAASLAGSSASVLAAGMTAGGQLTGPGSVTITTTDGLQNAGQLLATDDVTLSASALDLNGSTTGSTTGQVRFTAQSGDVHTRNAQVSTPGQLIITANQNAEQTLDNQGGHISAALLDFKLRNIDNMHGAIQQTGNADLAIDLNGGTFNNSAGILVANAANLSLSTGAFTNTAGEIGHSGSSQLTLNTASVENTGGQIVGNGSIVLSNTGNLTNADGLISAQGDLVASSKDVTNTASGAATTTTGVQSQGGNVSLDVQQLTNSGSILAGKDLRTRAASLDNSGTMYAAGGQTLAVGSAIASSGTIAAGKDLTVIAGSLAGTADSVLAAGMAVDGQLDGTGILSVTTSGALASAGQALATGTVSLTGASIDLGGSVVGSTGGDIHLRAQSGNVATRHARVSARGQLTIDADSNGIQLLDNTGGHLSSQQLQIKVGRLDNSQGAIEQTDSGVRVASIQTAGALNNTGGRIVTNAQDFTLTGGTLINGDGTIGHAGAGSLDIHAASIANGGGQIIGNGVLAVASAGNLDNSAGLIAAQNDLSIAAADLANTGSNAGIQSEAGSVDLEVGKMSNSGSVRAGHNMNIHATSLNHSGTMYAAGSHSIAVVDALSTSGIIAAGQDLSVHARSVDGSGTNVLAAGMAADGQLSGSAALAVTTSGLLQTAGQALAADNATLLGGSLDLSGSTTGSSNGDVHLTALSGDVLTRNAKVSAPGLLSITANANNSQLLDNTGGQLSGQQLQIKVSQLDNSQGVIQQTGSGVQVASIESTGALNNSGGQVVANAQNFTVASAALTNTSGLIGHAGTGALGIAAASVANNHGQINGNGTVTLASTGNVDNDAGLIAAQDDLVLHGAGLSNAGGTGAGIQSQAGDVSLNVQNMNNSGTLRAGQNLRAHAASLNNSGMMYAAGAQTVAVDNALVSSGTIAAAQDLTVNAGSLAGSGSNALAAGMGSDGKLAGAGALNLTTSGALTSTGQVLAAGDLHVTGASLNLSDSSTGSTNGNVALTAHSGNLLTRQAQVSTPGQLTLMAKNNANQLLDNTGGILSAHQLQVKAARIDNTGGVILQSGTGAQDTSIHSMGAIDNDAGRIVANATDFTLSAGGALSNVDGQVGHAGTGSLTVSANSLDNTRGRVVGNGSTTLVSAGFIDNSDGLVAAQQNLAVGAAGVDNGDGKLVAMEGALSLHSTQGSVMNTGGLIQAAQDLAMVAEGTGNSLHNAQGSILAGHDAELSTGSVSNDAGLIAAGRNLAVDTHTQSLSNLDGSANPGKALGLVAGGQLAIRSGALDNRGGMISAQTGLEIVSAGALDNAVRNGHAGRIYSGADLVVQASGLDNRAGQVLAVGAADVQLGGGTLNNSAGLVRVGQTLSLAAGAVNNGSTKAGDAGIEANTIAIATANLNNMDGAVRAGLDLSIRSDGQVNNNQGELSAGRALYISTHQAATPSLALSNAGGEIVADQSVSVRTGTLGGAGKIASRGAVSLDMQGDHTLAGTLQAGGDLQLQATGTLTNTVSVQAGRNLSVHAANLDNRVGAELVSGETTTLGVAGTLTNRGLIDGADTRIVASLVNNLGTGRIYGDRVAIGASSVNNLEETIGGITSAATIAGRRRVDIGAQYLTNREGALIFSAGDMAIGGALNCNCQAEGMAQTVNNNSATIEASQDLAISAFEIRNTNEHFATEVQQVSQTFITEYQGKNVTQRYLAGTPGVYTFVDESLHLQTPDGKYEEWNNYDYTRTVNETVVTQSDPGKIIAGGGIRLSAGSVFNDRSQIVAGDYLDVQGATVVNTKVEGTRTTTDHGTMSENWRDRHKGADRSGKKTSSYNPGSIVTTFDMNTTRYDEFAGTPSTGSGPGASTLSTVQAKANAGGTVTASNSSANLNSVSGTQAGSASGTATASQTGSQVQGNAASAAQAQAGTIVGDTGQQIAGRGTDIEQAQGDVIGDNTGRQVSGSTQYSEQAIGQATRQHAAGGVESLSGASAQSGKTPDTAGTATGASQIANRTMRPNFRLPTASLFKTHPESQARYLIETDPQFTIYKNWLSSDYMLDALQIDPAATQKRMGDGFYEQKLIREQVLALTGNRFLGDYSNDDEEYKSLMDNGLTYAKQWGLRPGVALSPEQVSQLTSDIVWLVTQDVQLPDGSMQSVLVPQVYVRVQAGDLDGSGALLTGREVNINLTGDFSSSGTVAGRNLVNIGADNIRNMGGTISASTLALQATKDIDNIGGTLKAQNAALLSAGRDLNLTSTTQSSSNTVGANRFSQTGIDRVAGLYVSGPAGVLLASAGNNINLTAAQIQNAGTGLTQLNAGKDLKLSAVNASVSQRVVWDADNRQSQSASMDVGSQVKGAGNLVLNAGQDINAKAAAVSAGQTLNVAAGRDVNILAGQATQSLDEAHKHTSKGFMSKRTVTTHDQQESTNALGSSLEGDSVNVAAGRDLTIKGSSIVADQNLSLDAARNLSVLSAEGTATSTNSTQVKKSGFTGGYASGNLSVGYGKSTTSTQGNNASVTQRESTIGALNGSAKLKSGETLQVVASDIAAKENLTLIGKNVDLSAAQNTSDSQQSASSKSSGFSVGVTVNPLAAAKDAYKESTKNASSSSTIGKLTSKADGVAEGLWAATTAVTVQFGSKSANSNQNQSTSTARITSLNTGKDLTILATDGSINSQGTQMTAEGNAMIVAKDSIKFDVAHNTETASQNAKSSGFSFDNRSAMMAGTFNNKSKGNGATDTVTGTKLSVGGATTVATQTGDIALIGANVVSDGTLAFSAARDLTITSAQDTVRNTNQSDNKAIGKVVISDTERFAGYHNEKHKDNSNEVTQVASNVASLKGDVVLSAGEKYTQASSNVLAGNDVSITAKSIDITALQDTGSRQESNSDLKVGAFARISSPLIDLVNNVDAARKSDGRLQAMQGMAAAAQGYGAGKAIASNGILVKGEVGVGFASSSNSSNTNGATAVASTINGGNNVTLTSTAGDIHATGATLGAGKTLSLDSAQDIVLDASQSTAHSDGKNNSAGVEVGVGFQAGAQGTGVYAYASANVGNGHHRSDSKTNNNTQLEADTLNITSKGDTTLRGATATANTINADLGGNLAIESLQDLREQESSQTNAGARVQVSFGTAWSASGNISQSNTNGSSATVGQQSGLFAGDGGYHVKADTVDLKGGAIASTNKLDAELTTNKLTATNIENSMRYSAGSVSVAGSIAGGSGKGDSNPDGSAKPEAQQQLFGDRNSGNVAPGVPVIQKGSDSSTTYATVTDGKISIGGVRTSSVADLGINNDASKAHSGLDRLPDLQTMLKDQQAMSAAAGTVLATSKEIIGDVATSVSKAAAHEGHAAIQVLKDPNSTDEQRAAAERAFDSAQRTQADWGAGGIYSRAMNAGVVVLVGGMAGQSGGKIIADAAGPSVAKAVGDIGTGLMEQASKDVLKYGKLAEEARANHDPVAAEAYDAKAKEASDTAINWSDNGLYRVGLHAATQGMLGGLSNGAAGAVGSAAGVVSGNLGQQLGAQLGEAKADELGLTGEKRAALVNAYQNTGAVVGGMLAGAAAAGATGQIADAGALLAAAQGGEAAGTVDAFNRRLHISEKWQIQQLAKNDPKKQARLLIASCALTKCSAEFAIGSPEYVETKAIEDLGNSAAFKADRDLLSAQIGVRGKRLFTYDSESLVGSDADVDALKRWNNTYGVTTRIGGGMQVIGGVATGVVSGGLFATAAAACPETAGAGCAVALVGASGVAWSADQISTGLITAWTGRATPTLGGKLVSNILGVSSGTGELINGVLGLSPLAVDAALANGIIKIPATVSKSVEKAVDARAYITNNHYRDGDISPQALSTSSGVTIRANPEKTTTVLGTFADDTNNIINGQMGAPKSLSFSDPKKGGFNLLNTPDELYASLGPDKFWKEVNVPFLQAAIDRGDDIYLATRPTPAAIERLSNSDGLSGFGREYDYLVKKGYVYDWESGKMCFGGCIK